MTGKQVWCPDESRAAEEEEGLKEGGRGSSFCKPVPLKSKTRVVRPRKANNVTNTHETTLSGYSTVEKSTEKSIIEFSHVTIAHSPSHPDFCGWVDRELPQPSNTNRRSIQTPADGLRNTLTSRLASRTSDRQRYNYEFQHFLEAHDHIEHYRSLYCFTTVSLYPTEEDHDRPESVDQGKHNVLKLEVKSLYRGDPYMRELASRLGVGESIRDPQLLTPPKHTPPSIVKKNRNRTDLAIDLCTNKSRNDECEDDLCTPGTDWGQVTMETNKVPPFSSRPVSRPSPLELPKIPEAPHIQPMQRTRHKTSSSVISINKYLRVTSHGESVEEEDSLPNVATSHSPSSTSTQPQSQQSLVKDDENYSTSPVKSTPPTDKLVFKSEPPVTIDQLFSLDRAQKERVITNKAHSLGLTSREWASPPSRKQVNTYVSHFSRPTTRQKDIIDNSTGQTIQRKDRVQSSIKPRPPSRVQGKVGREKLEKLRSIYDSSHVTRCASRGATRPPSRVHSSLKKRPATRIDRSKTDQRLDCLDESSYWNELPTSPKKDESSKVKQFSAKFSPVRLAIELSQSQKPQNKPRVTMATTLTRQRRKKKVKQTNEEVNPGASPQQIAEHLSRLKQKFEGILNVHKQDISTAQ